MLTEKIRYRMLRYFVILKCEVTKKRCMLGYFVILKCKLSKTSPALVLPQYIENHASTTARNAVF